MDFFERGSIHFTCQLMSRVEVGLLSYLIRNKDLAVKNVHRVEMIRWIGCRLLENTLALMLCRLVRRPSCVRVEFAAVDASLRYYFRIPSTFRKTEQMTANELFRQYYG